MKNTLESPLMIKEGIMLFEQSKLISTFAVEIAKQTLAYNDAEIIENIKIASLLADIGKCCKTFQNGNKLTSKEKNVKYLPNEIGWAFLTKYLHKSPEFILDCVFWSDGIFTNKNKQMGEYTNNNILDTIDDSDKHLMLEFLKEVLPENYGYYYNETKSDAPIYYSKDNSVNAEKIFVRTCVISACKLVYNLKDDKLRELIYTQDINQIREIISDLTKRNGFVNKESMNFSDYNPKRLEIQKSIPDICEKTTIVNAPAGFGKSIISVFWNLFYSKKKMIVVCP
ncbi:MAG TPA: hypothetical protein VN026_10870, partial [Bacteroidia bacterium]|nr:hypothetical protein [Bacteroidia bacterium]